MAIKSNVRPKDVCILVRVYKAYENPSISMYADPWRFYLDGSILLEPESDYDGHISNSAHAILAQKFTSAGLAPEVHEIYKGLKVELGQIRLLRLELEDDDNKPLKGSLVCCDLGTNFKFWAISLFGDPGLFLRNSNLSLSRQSKGKLPSLNL